MAKYEHFEDLPVWQEAARLYNTVLDLLEEPGVPLTPGFRNQLDRASLSVSNNVAEGFERSTTNELLSFIAIARGSAGEVRSMMAVVKNRPKLKRYLSALQRIRTLAESCARQLTGAGPVRWTNCHSKAGGICPSRYAPNAKRRKRRATTDSAFSKALTRAIRSTIPQRLAPPAAKSQVNRPLALSHLPSAILLGAAPRTDGSLE
jgi:four helix bundle protein